MTLPKSIFAAFWWRQERSLMSSRSLVGNHHTLGHHLSEEHRKKLSEAGKRRRLSEEHKRKISESHKGMQYDEDFCRKVSQGRIGIIPKFRKPCSSEARRNISLANGGNGIPRSRRGLYSLKRKLLISPVRMFLNSKFERAHLHHMGDGYAIYIPESLHRSIQHSLVRNENMYEINYVAMEWSRKHR